MKKGQGRPQKLGDLIQRELSDLVQRELRDPRVGMITITGVDVPAKEAESGKTKLDKADHYMKVSALKMVAATCP